MPERRVRVKIRPITGNDLDAVLQVYRQCEDFLALGPVAIASMDMVLKDIELSKNEGGIFCGIFDTDNSMIGVVDYVPDHYRGNPAHAFLELLMIAAPHRAMGLGARVVRMIEARIRKNPAVTAILSGVQVNNPAAIRFWQRHGYRIVSEPRLHPDGTTAMDLRRDLADRKASYK